MSPEIPSYMMVEFKIQVGVDTPISLFRQHNIQVCHPPPHQFGDSLWPCFTQVLVCKGSIEKYSEHRVKKW